MAWFKRESGDLDPTGENVSGRKDCGEVRSLPADHLEERPGRKLQRLSALQRHSALTRGRRLEYLLDNND